MRLLLDEHISPALVARLAEVGIYAQSVPHVGLAGRADHEIWQYALDHDFAVVTTNARDFIELLDVDVHPGLIVLRESGLSHDEQWRRISLWSSMRRIREIRTSCSTSSLRLLVRDDLRRARFRPLHGSAITDDGSVAESFVPGYQQQSA
jgi:predicted nuclease of predicted toxin-antitoxin system